MTMSRVEEKKLIAWMRNRFMPECTRGWDSTIHVRLRDGGAFTVDVRRRKMHISAGLNGAPLAVLDTDCPTLRQVLRGDLPLDIAIMEETLRSDNMIETFKFITVFRPVTRCRTNPHEKKK